MEISCYSIDVLRPFLEALFGSTGVSSEDAVLVSDTFIEANLRGVDSHGIRLVPAYIRRLAGGGVKSGLTYGATDEYGYRAVENPVEIHDLHATMLHLMGIDHERLTLRFGGRDMRLTDVHGKVMHDWIA